MTSTASFSGPRRVPLLGGFSVTMRASVTVTFARMFHASRSNGAVSTRRTRSANI